MLIPPHHAGPHRRRTLFPGWLLAALILFTLLVAATVCPIGWRPHFSQDPNEERFWAFFMLGLAAKFAVPRRHLPTLACVVLLAMGTEAAQLLAPGRHARVEDGTIKALGAIAGVQTGYAFFKLRRAWRTFAAARQKREGQSLPATNRA